MRIKLFLSVCFVILFSAFNTAYAEDLKKKDQQNNQQKKNIRIGLLIPDEERAVATHGTELAIQLANEKGGYAGIPYQLIVKPTSGLWGTSSKKSVNLVFEDEVHVIMGSLDGRNAHLAEQVAAKTKVVFLSAWATEMSLSNAYVPWYFRCVPDDKKQSAALIDEIYFNRNLKKVVLIGTDKNDSELAVRAFFREAKQKGIPEPELFVISDAETQLHKTVSGITAKNFEAIVLIGSNEFAIEVMAIFNQQKNRIPVFGTLAVSDNQKTQNTKWSQLENLIFAGPEFLVTEKGHAFQKKFQEKYGYQPGPAAAYAYDGMNVVIEAVKMAKPALTNVIDDRDKIINAFLNISYSNGITGNIEFDEDGNRLDSITFIKIENGKPVLCGKK